MAAIELHGTVGRGDLLRAIYFFQLRRTWLVPLFLLAPFILAAAAVTAERLLPESSGYRVRISNGAIRSTMPFIFIFLAWCAFNAVAPMLRVRKLCATAKHVNEPSTLQFTESGVLDTSVNSSSQFRWNVVTTVFETRTLFMIFMGEASVLIPKRYFQSSEEMSAWRAVVEAGIAPKKIVRPGVVARHC
jgi:hypothetical protein